MGALTRVVVLIFAAASDKPAPFRILLPDVAIASAVEAALAGAAQRLAEPECARVLSDFSDAKGRRLQQNLDALELRAADYLRYVVFADGSAEGGCATRIDRLAFTAPGSRVVFVCPKFREEQRRKPDLAEAVLIHEVLHTLGLGENPPGADAITRRVLARCWRGETKSRHGVLER